MDHSEEFLTLVNDAKARIHEVTVDGVRKKQQRSEAFEFVDVREDSEWNKGKAIGSTHLGKGIIERDIEATIPDKGSEIILYCGGGFRSALAADTLQKMGYSNVHSMAGGIKAWSDRGYPIAE